MRVIQFDEAAVFDIESRSTTRGLHLDDVAGIRAAARVLPPDGLSGGDGTFSSVTNRALLELVGNPDGEWELLRRVHLAAVLMIWDETTWMAD